MIEERRKATERPAKRGPDNLDQWAAIVTDLKAQLALRHVGLFVRSYSEGLESERFVATRRDVHGTAPMVEKLASIRPDEVTIFE